MHRLKLSICLIVLSLFTHLTQPSQAEPLRINEILASASQTDAFGTALEWMELYNPGPDTVSLSSYTVTDDPQIPGLWHLPPVTLGPSQYLQIFTTGYDLYDNGSYHASFRLRREGEYLGLYQEGALVDSIAYPMQKRDISFGRNGLDVAQWLYISTPSPGRPNASNGKIGFTAAPVFSHSAGLQNGPMKLELAPRNPGEEVRYTLDGSLPTETSLLYTGPIAITKTTPVRARAFRSGFFPSDAVTHTYLIESQAPLPIVAVSTDPKNLWDSSIGIYTNASQHGRQWERPMALEWIQPGGPRRFALDAGLRIQGGASRDRAEKKSFRLYFRSDYGEGKLRERVIPATPVDEFDRLVLRAGYNDSWIHWDAKEREVAVYVSDQLGRNIHGDMGAVFSHGTFVNLYLNGAYWGLYNLSERIDDEFLQTYYGFDDWDINVDGELRQGDKVEWNRLVQFLQRNNLAEAKNYETLKTMLDVPQFTSYFILNIFVQNHDWPHHNFFMVRERHPLAKWKMVVWDIEDSFGSGASRGEINLNTFARAKEENHSFISLLFNRMLRNKEYQSFFIAELERYLAGPLSETNLSRRLDELVTLVDDAMMMEAARWNKTKTMTDWNNALGIARRFFRERPAIVRRHVYQGLGLAVPTSIPTLRPDTTPTPTPTFNPLPNNTPTPTIVPPTPTPLPSGALGLFTRSEDIGDVQTPGVTKWDIPSNTYIVVGSGDDVWNSRDECQFVYRPIAGDFVLEAKIDGENQGTSDWAKLLLMARESVESDAANFAARFRLSDFQASSQWRLAKGSNSGSTPTDLRIDRNRHDGRLKIERKGNVFRSFYFDIQTSLWTVMDEQIIAMSDPVVVGLAVTSHDDGHIAKGFFREVKLQGQSVNVAEWGVY